MTKTKTIQDYGNYWAIRLTSDSLELDKTFKILEHYDKFIISEEGGTENTRLHQHILLCTENTSELIKQDIRQGYPDLHGNKMIYVRPSRDNRQLTKYTLKEGNYLYKGFTDEYIKEISKLSVSKTNIKQDIIKLEELYILQKIQTIEFIDKYLNYKVKYDQPLYTTHIKAYIKKMMIRSGRLESLEYSRSILRDIENEFQI